MKTDQTKKIAELNDLFRKAPEDYGHSGRYVLTEGISALPIMDQYQILTRVGGFEAFTPDNDPYNEHDFGAFDYAGQKVFWKIDYYNLTLDGGSEDPSDPAKTTRVLTIMLAQEY